MSQVQICNLALGRIGQGASRPIQSLTEDSESARACNRVFDHVVDAVLREYVWPFAQKAAALAPVPQVVPGWGYVYEMPADCLFLRAITDAETDPFQDGHVQYERAHAFKIVARDNLQGRVIASQLPEAWAWYTAPVTDPTFWDASARDALAWRIAAELALGLKATPEIARYCSMQYEMTAAGAAANFGNEHGRLHQPLPANIAVRQA